MAALDNGLRDHQLLLRHERAPTGRGLQQLRLVARCSARQEAIRVFDLDGVWRIQLVEARKVPAFDGCQELMNEIQRFQPGPPYTQPRLCMMPHT